MDEIEIVRRKGETAVQIVNLFVNMSVPGAAVILPASNKEELRLDKTWKKGKQHN